jgi:AraC-like DNA-binding protein
MSVVVLGLFSIIYLSSFDRGKNKWLILAFGAMVWPWFNLLIGVNRFDLIPYSGFLQNPTTLILFSPALYFYTLELVNPGGQRKNKKFRLHLFFFISLYIFFAFNGIGDPFDFEKIENKFSLYVLVIGTIIITLYYSFFTLRLVEINQNKFKNEFSDTNLYNSLDWIKWLVWATLGMPIIGGLSTFLSFHIEEKPPELFVLITQLFSFGCLTYFSLRQPVIYQTESAIQKEIESAQEAPLSSNSNSPYSNITLSEEDKEAFINRINTYMLREKPYLNPKVRMPELAKALKIPRHIFSYLINEHYQMNFFQFTNQYRIEHAKSLLVKGTHENYTLETISQMSGFNSKSTFNTRFKEITGISPKEYQQMKA